MRKPVLVIMAAGMGSRYGGLKQIDPIDEQGYIIIDYSMYDAKRAGFEEVVFIIKKSIEEDFKEVVGDRISKYMKTEYVYQEIDTLPEGFEVPEGREKPWGTAHAILCAKDKVQGPFAVINADDYYGQEAFEVMYQYLLTHKDDEKYRFAMVGYQLKNTVTEYGHVARGVCEENESQELVGICERTRIEKHGEEIAYTEDDGKTWNILPDDTTVSMNMWGFTQGILQETEDIFSGFLKEALAENPLKCEYFLPMVVNTLVENGKGVVKVLKSKDKWYGVTYKEDKESVVQAIKEMKEEGIYPDCLWK